MSNKPVFDGGTAYPIEFADGHSFGLSKREWFAGMALQGLIARFYDYDIGWCKQESYKIADEMLKEGSK